MQHEKRHSQTRSFIPGSGKLQRRASPTPGIVSLNRDSSGSMSVLDSTSKCQFLIDSGADISVLPLSFLTDKKSASFPRPGQRLRAANGTFIDTFGKRSLLLTLPSFSVRHTFRIARVDKPILGADFFRNHSILIDVKNNCLHLPGGDVIPSKPSTRPGAVSLLRSNFQEILSEFPDLSLIHI